MQKRGGEVFYARPEFCTDNGAMIAYAGMVRLNAGATADLSVSVRPRWPLAELPEAYVDPLPPGEGIIRLHPQHPFLFQKCHDRRQSVARLQIGEGPRALAAHAVGVTLHHLQ